MALLAVFLTHNTPAQSLADYLNTEVFANANLETTDPDPAVVAGFETFMRDSSLRCRWNARLSNSPNDL